MRWTVPGTILGTVLVVGVSRYAVLRVNFSVWLRIVRLAVVQYCNEFNVRIRAVFLFCQSIAEVGYC